MCARLTPSKSTSIRAHHNAHHRRSLEYARTVSPRYPARNPKATSSASVDAVSLVMATSSVRKPPPLPQRASHACGIAQEPAFCAGVADGLAAPGCASRGAGPGWSRSSTDAARPAEAGRAAWCYLTLLDLIGIPTHDWAAA